MWNFARKMLRDICYRVPKTPHFTDYPSNIELELTNDCNFSCSHCPRTYLAESIYYLDFDLVEKIVSEIKSYDCCSLRLVGLGEPTLHPRFRDVISLITSANIKLELTSNGNIFHIMSLEEILVSGITTLEISIDGSDVTTYEQKRPEGCHRFLTSKIAGLAELAKNATDKPRIVVRRVVFPNDSEEELRLYNEYWFKYSDSISYNIYTPVGRSTIYENFTKCQSIFSELKIRSTGGVPLCRFQCNFQPEIELGNIANSSIQELWNSSALNERRNVFLQENWCHIDYCKYCAKQQEGKVNFIIVDKQ